MILVIDWSTCKGRRYTAKLYNDSDKLVKTT